MTVLYSANQSDQLLIAALIDHIVFAIRIGKGWEARVWN